MIFDIYLVLYYIVQILLILIVVGDFQNKGRGRQRRQPKYVAARRAAAVVRLYILIIISTSIHTVIMVPVFVYMMVYSKPWELKHTIAIVPFIILVLGNVFEFIKGKYRQEEYDVVGADGNMVRA